METTNQTETDMCRTTEKLRKRTMFGGYEIESMIFAGSYDDIVSFLKHRIEQWAFIRWATMNYIKFIPIRTQIDISIKHTSQCKEGMGDILTLLMGQRLCVCQETKSVFILDGDTIGMEAKIEGGEMAGKVDKADKGFDIVDNENEVDKKEPKLGTPLTELTAREMQDILQKAIPSKKIVIHWDDIIDGDGDKVVVWVGDSLDTEETLIDGPAKYMIIPKKAQVFKLNYNTVGADKPALNMIGLGLSAIIKRESYGKPKTEHEMEK